MDPLMKKHLRNRPFAEATVRTAETLGEEPLSADAVHATSTAMIAYAILDHADAVRELTAALERGDGDA